MGAWADRARGRAMAGRPHRAARARTLRHGTAQTQHAKRTPRTHASTLSSALSWGNSARLATATTKKGRDAAHTHTHE